MLVLWENLLSNIEKQCFSVCTEELSQLFNERVLR